MLCICTLWARDADSALLDHHRFCPFRDRSDRRGILCQTTFFGNPCGYTAEWHISGQHSITPHFTCDRCKKGWMNQIHSIELRFLPLCILPGGFSEGAGI